MLYKIGDQWYRLEGFALVATDAPETAPAEGEYFDATDLVAEYDDLGVTEVKTKAADTIAAYNDARAAARGDKAGKAELDAARSAQPAAVIAHHVRTERIAAHDSLADPEDALKDPKGDEGKTDDAKASKDGKADDAKNGGDGDADGGDGNDGDDTGDGTDTDGTDGGDVKVPDDLSSLPDAAALVTAAAVLRNGGLDGLIPGALNGGKALTKPNPVEQAVIVAAADGGFDVAQPLNLDQITTVFKNFGRAVAGRRAASAKTIGHYLLFGDSPKMVVSAAAASQSLMLGDDRRPVGTIASEEFHIRRAGTLGITAAAEDRCGPEDVRREIAYAGDHSAPLMSLLDSYPAPHCALTYYRDISIDDVASGITVWDTAARTAYQNALDAFRADPTAANLAALKAAEKTCAIAGCPPTDTVTMLPIAACLEYPTDLEYCSPEAIRAYNRALERRWIRVRSANFLAVMATKSSTVTVDADAGVWINGDTPAIQLGAEAVVDYVYRTLKATGVVQERVTEANYIVVMPFGMEMMLRYDHKLAYGQEALADLFGGARIVTTLDVATGGSQPWTAVPDEGTTTAFDPNLLPPSDWSLNILDPTDWFAISRPDIELGAQLTPESVKGNMVFGGFMESHEGYGKDGNHPSWVVDFTDLKYNGARPDRINPAGLL